jgi:hypothetical protein
MAELSRKKIIRESVIAGLIGAAVLAAGQTLAAAVSGLEPGAPWMLASSVALGREGVEGRLDFLHFALGTIIHFGLGALFGAIFGAIVAGISRPVRNNLALELTGGVLYGLVIWLITQQILGRVLYPWYLEFNAPVQALLHGLFFGVPMATWLALRIRDVETPGVHEARHRYQTSTGDDSYLRFEREREARRAQQELPGRRLPPGGETGRPGGPTIH